MVTSNLLERITTEPNKRSGRPCIRGMRISVKDVLDLLSNGASHAQIIEDFPDLEEDDIRAALAYAAAHIDLVVRQPGERRAEESMLNDRFEAVRGAADVRGRTDEIMKLLRDDD